MTSCKKNDAAPAPSNGFYLNANIGNSSYKSTSVLGGISGGNMIILAYSISGSDTTALVLAFPKSAPLNQAIPFDTKNAAMAWADSKNPGDYFVTNPIINPGSLTVTSLNTSDSTIAGNFSGSLIDGNLKTLSVSNGTFKTKFLSTSAVSIPVPGGSKR